MSFVWYHGFQFGARLCTSIAGSVLSLKGITTDCPPCSLINKVLVVLLYLVQAVLTLSFNSFRVKRRIGFDTLRPKQLSSWGMLAVNNNTCTDFRQLSLLIWCYCLRVTREVVTPETLKARKPDAGYWWCTVGWKFSCLMLPKFLWSVWYILFTICASIVFLNWMTIFLPVKFWVAVIWRTWHTLHQGYFV